MWDIESELRNSYLMWGCKDSFLSGKIQDKQTVTSWLVSELRRKNFWTCGHNMVLSIFFFTTEMSREEKFLIICKTQLPYLTYGDICLAFNNVFQGSDDLKVMCLGSQD